MPSKDFKTIFVPNKIEVKGSQTNIAQQQIRLLLCSESFRRDVRDLRERLSIDDVNNHIQGFIDYKEAESKSAEIKELLKDKVFIDGTQRIAQKLHLYGDGWKDEVINHVIGIYPLDEYSFNQPRRIDARIAEIDGSKIVELRVIGDISTNDIENTSGKIRELVKMIDHEKIPQQRDDEMIHIELVVIGYRRANFKYSEIREILEKEHNKKYRNDRDVRNVYERAMEKVDKLYH